MFLFNPSIDWIKASLDLRQLEIGPYKQYHEPWQLELDKGITTHNKSYIQLPRAHGKSSTIAWWLLVLLINNPDVDGVIGAVDFDNAKIFSDAALTIKRMHPNLFSSIEIQNKLIINTQNGSKLRIITSDAASSFGMNKNVYVLTDFHAWQKEEFFNALIGGSIKQENTLWIIESNALSLNNANYTWVSKVRDQYKNDPECFFYKPNGWLAQWNREKAFKEFAHWSPSQFKRYVENQDTSDQDAYLTPEQVEAVEVLPGISDPIKKPSLVQVTGVDYGATHDFAVVSTIQMDSDEHGPVVNLLRMDALHKATIDEVEKVCMNHAAQYKSYPIVADSWQMKSTCQRFPGLFVEFIPGVAKVQQITQLLRELILNRRIRFYKQAGLLNGWDLKKELIRAVLREMPYGERVDHKTDGYTDRIMSLGMALHYCLIEHPFPKYKKPPKQPDWNAPIPIVWSSLRPKPRTGIQIGFGAPPK